MTKVELHNIVAGVLEAANFESFIGPLTRRGFLLLNPGADGQCRTFIEQKFGKPAEEGVIIYPCGFGDWEPMKSEAEKYAQTLREQNFPAELLLIEHEWNFAAYVYVPISAQGYSVS